MDTKKKRPIVFPDWSIGGPETGEYIMNSLGKECSLKYKNIQPSLKEIAFYQLPSKSDAIPENTFQKVGDKDDDEDDDFTSKPPSHKPHNKEKGKQKVTVSLSTSIKKFNMHAGLSCKEKSPPVLHGYRKAKSTPFSSVSTPVENNVPVQELHNQPDDSANTTPPRSSNQPQDTKAGEIGVTNEFKELCLFILENFKQVMDAVNKSSPQSGAPCQDDGSKSPTHVLDWSNNNSMKDDNQISTFLDKPHFDINEDRTFRFILEEHVKDNVQENYQPAQIHIQDPLSTGDINALQNDGIQQPQSQFELLDVLLPSLDTINPKKCVVVHLEVVVHPEGVVYDTTPVPVQRTGRLDRWNSSPYSTNFGSSSEKSLGVGCFAIVERRIYVYDSYRAAGHNSYVRDEIQKLAQLQPMYVSMEIANNSDDTQDQDIAYDVTYVEDIPQQGSGALDCGIYLLAFAEYLSEGEGIPVQYLDSKLHRIRYSALLWQYAAKKMEEGVVSENEAPPKMMRPPARIDNSQLVRID
ncbi:hypothetical protein KY290_036508 [Solanum tuberosum]|uniref:Ubiquitin-like protease family profile domain-containing protein n=1 Tax=Solanum tuberosum TaxID=4113 RepID=A0ABQ7TTN6_SOLTU|nr:hypothetical protein KY289_037864 [Solanum tuberosum]KAH0639230.1 hypothetical protein KY285_035816 [Solanum tuberosum]KAH0737803.1 hypothetical protein KY290_036508 [Solanum tuberosum]